MSLHPIRTVLLILMVGGLAPLLAKAQGPLPPTLTQEYFVRQAAEEPLVIRVNPFEAEFQVLVMAPNGELLRTASLPGNRTQPVFLYIDGAGRERQLDIRIDAAWHTDRTRFGLEFNRLSIRDELSERLARAYQMLAYGYEELSADTPANWSVKVNMLMQASRSFQDFGMEELQLWAGLAAAHLVQFRLSDPYAALELNGRVLEMSRTSASREVEFSALALTGETLLRLAQGAPADATIHEEAQSVLASVGALAEKLDLQYEQAYAHYLRGLELADRRQFSSALDRFDQALIIAEARQAMELATAIRESMVEAHDQLGDFVAKEQVLGSVVDQLASDGAQDELVRNLLQQAALYLELYRYPAAINALMQALAVDNVSLSRAQAHIMLGQARYEIGQWDAAEQALNAALINPETGLFRRPNPLLPLAEGLGVLADIHRQRGDLAEARRVRLVQSRHLESTLERARWSVSRIHDELAAGNLSEAWQVWRQSQALLRADGFEMPAALVQLALCARGGDECSAAGLRNAHAAARAGGTPRQQAGASHHWAQYLARSGETGQASVLLEALLDEVWFLQTRLPGVLGAWFFEQGPVVFGASLDLSRALGGPDDAASLLTLSRVRTIGQAIARDDPADELRAQIAGGDGAGSLYAAREEFRRRHEGMSMAGLRAFLDDMRPDEAVLGFDVDGRRAHAWLALRSGVERFDRQLPEGFDDLLQRVREDRATGIELEQVGQALLGHLRGRLPRTLYWLPMGPLLGVPLDSLRLDGRFLAESHRVVVLSEFPRATAPGRRLGMEWPERVFLAGHPTDWSPRFPDRLRAPPELAAVTDRFVGTGLHVVQGNALLADEFAGSRLEQAQLIHLAMPAFIGLDDAESSWFELSEPGRGQGRERLAPSALRQWSLGGALVVISGSAMPGAPSSRFDGRLGLVDDLFAAGAAAVIAASRPAGDVAGAWIAGEFYAALARTGDVAESLATVRERQLTANPPTEASGVALQLFIR